MSRYAMQRQVHELVAVGEQDFVGSGSGRASHRRSQPHGAFAHACVPYVLACGRRRRLNGFLGGELAVAHRLLEYICEK